MTRRAQVVAAGSIALASLLNLSHAGSRIDYEQGVANDIDRVTRSGGNFDPATICGYWLKTLRSEHSQQNIDDQMPECVQFANTRYLDLTQTPEDRLARLQSSYNEDLDRSVEKEVKDNIQNAYICNKYEGFPNLKAKCDVDVQKKYKSIVSQPSHMPVDCAQYAIHAGIDGKYLNAMGMAYTPLSGARPARFTGIITTADEKHLVIEESGIYAVIHIANASKVFDAKVISVGSHISGFGDALAHGITVDTGESSEITASVIDAVCVD